MKKILLWTVLAALMTAGMLLTCGGAEAAGEDEPAEWTVMFYFCGSDLESRYSYASQNLTEISEVVFPYDIHAIFGAGDTTTTQMMREMGRVNILVETGGARKWHAEDAGMKVNPDALQRWRFRYYPEKTGDEYVRIDEFELLETLPPENMGASETLSDYIRWCAQHYPAKKYALVLWGHGDGARTGLLIDELFNNDILCLTELNQALEGGGVYLEALVIDACLMANIETAWAARNSVHWMVASEETVPGQGTAIGSWLQALVNHPAMDGRWLGRCVCDMTNIKYANLEDERSRSLLTWSVIDLTKIDRLVRAFDRFFEEVGNELVNNPRISQIIAQILFQAEEYGESDQRMRDFGCVLFSMEMVNTMDSDVLDEAMAALADAVDYVVRGDGRSEARGLSFCYAAGAEDEELTEYAGNCPSAAYLAYLDAVSTWTAPEWVYEKTEWLPEVGTIEAMQIDIVRRISADGFPALQIDQDYALDEIYYYLYKLDEESGEVILLGKSNCHVTLTEDYSLLWMPNDPMSWPSIDGIPCCMELVRNSGEVLVYNIPVQINTDLAILRCGRTIRYHLDGTPGVSEYEIYGVWEGYNENSTLLNRSVEPLAMLSGRNYRLLYPVDGPEDRGTNYAASEEMMMYRHLDVAETTLPPGTYYIEYELRSVFMQTMELERFEVQWDGQRMTCPGAEAWTGTMMPEWE